MLSTSEYIEAKIKIEVESQLKSHDDEILALTNRTEVLESQLSVMDSLDRRLDDSELYS